MMGFDAVRVLTGRYAGVLRAAWAERGSLGTELVHREEADFMPAAIALRDTPLHPVPRVTVLILAALIGCAVFWACIGKVDVIASAPGKIIPTGEVKVIQAQDTAIVTRIEVTDGQHVDAGQTLVDLDATDAHADEASARAELASTRAEVQRGHALLNAIAKPGSTAPVFVVGDFDPGMIAREQHVLDGEYRDYTLSVARARSEVGQAEAATSAAQGEIDKLEETLPIEQKKLDDFDRMIVKGYVGRHDYYAEQQAVIQMRHDLSIQQARRAEAAASLAGSREKMEESEADVRKTWLEKIHDDEQKISTLEQSAARASRHKGLLSLRSPVRGTVQQLAAHTEGGVVTAAQPIMTVVPDERRLRVSAVVDNQDIGFVHAGQDVEVKIEAFPFSRYGTLHGTVARVSNDAKQDDKLGLIFMTEVDLESDVIAVDGKSIHLTPGMAVTAEIKTGRRSVISYVLSPLADSLSSSFHER